MSAKADIRRKRREQATAEANNLRGELTPTFQKATDLARERGSTSWLTTLPLEEHGFSLHKSAFIDVLAFITANLLSEVCNDVRVEPDLQELTIEVLSGRTAITTDGARLDIAVNGLWGGRFERTFLDVRVFNPYAPSNRNTTMYREMFQKARDGEKEGLLPTRKGD